MPGHRIRQPRGRGLDAGRVAGSPGRGGTGRRWARRRTGRCWPGLQQAQAKLTAVNAAVLAAFTAQCGYEPDGHKSARAWLINKTGISKGAAGNSVGWQKRLARHRRIGETMTAGGISESWAREIARGPTSCRRTSGTRPMQILLDAAASGLPLEDLGTLARKIDVTGRCSIPTRTTATATTATRTDPGTGTCGSAPPWTALARWTGT